MNLHRPRSLSAFGLTIEIIWTKLGLPHLGHLNHNCSSSSFYLEIPNIARFLALPAQKQVLIEIANEEISFAIINTWLKGTVIAFFLQYYDNLVFHGSAVLMADCAILFSGPSGAGKSTLARALSRRGHPFITDDLLVIQINPQGIYHILPGPPKIKLWEDGMHHFKHEVANAEQVMLKINKYAVLIDNYWPKPAPIKAFYAIDSNNNIGFSCQKLDKLNSLKIIMQNIYRHFMLKPLGKLPYFLQVSKGLTEQITVSKLMMTKDFKQLEDVMDYIEAEQNTSTNPYLLSKEFSE